MGTNGKLTEMLVALLDKLPLNTVLTSRQLAELAGVRLTYVHGVSLDPALKPYRTEPKGKGKEVAWGSKASMILRAAQEEASKQQPPAETTTPVAHVQTQDEKDLSEYHNSTVAKLQAENKKLRLALLDKKETAKIIAGAITPVTVSTYLRKERSDLPKATLGFCIADMHIGEVVDPEQMGGSNAYNFALAEKGLLDITRRVMEWADVMSRGYDIQEVVVWVLGDIVTGNLHDSVQNEFPVPVASARAGGLLASVYLLLAQRFSVRVVQVSGNHDRMTQAMPSKSVTKQSMAYPAFVIAEEIVRKQLNVKVETPEDAIPVVEAHPGKYIAALHGHQIKSGGVSPYYGIARRVNAMLRERMSNELPKLATVLLGHFHNFSVLESGQSVLCPSLMGPTEWSRQQGFQGQPAQLAFLIGDHGLFAFTPFERRW